MTAATLTRALTSQPAEAVDAQTAPYAGLVLRIVLGLQFLAHAGLKVFVFTLAGSAKFFASIGLPAEFAYVIIAAEALGGVALILGVYTRWVSLALVPVLLGAIVLVHGQYGFFFMNAGGGWEFPAFWAAALVVQALLGDGAYALRRAR